MCMVIHFPWTNIPISSPSCKLGGHVTFGQWDIRVRLMRDNLERFYCQQKRQLGRTSPLYCTFPLLSALNVVRRCDTWICSIHLETMRLQTKAKCWGWQSGKIKMILRHWWVCWSKVSNQELPILFWDNKIYLFFTLLIIVFISKKHSLLIQFLLYSSGKSSTYFTLYKQALSTRKSPELAHTWTVVLEHLYFNAYYSADSVLHIGNVKIDNMCS